MDLSKRTYMILHSFSCLFFNFLDVDRTHDRRLGLQIDFGQELGPFVGKRGRSRHVGQCLSVWKVRGWSKA